MKANHTYENIIKNKLDQLNGPDTDIMWGDMKGILDVHMPQKKKRRFIGWWFFDGGSGMYLGIAILITLGSLTTYRILTNKENIATTSSNTQSLKQSTTGDKKDSDNNKTTGENNTVTVPASIQSQKTEETGEQKSAVNSDLSSTSSDKTNKDVVTKKSENSTVHVNNNGTEHKPGTGNTKNKNINLNNVNQSRVQGEEIFVTAKKESTVALYNSESFNSLLTIKPQTQYFRITDIGNKTPGSDFLAKLNKQQKKGWVIGGSFNYHMPISTQVMSSINAQGKKGNLADYLPSLYVQYHLNENWYLQSEIQYSSPQHTPNHVLFDEWNNQTTHQKEENVVYLNKLYYFSVPVTIHYSPLKNIHVGTGIQISQLVKSILTDEQAVWQNGMEGWQKTIVNKQIYSKSPGSKSYNGNVPARIDTASQNFKRTDLRLVLDANYNVGKINVGFSFNMGLSNYMNSKLGTNSVYIKDRNEDLKIYLRYNLWDQRSKKAKH